MEVSGTFHPATTLRSLGLSPGRRLTFSRHAGPRMDATARTPTGCSTIIEYQVILKPSPEENCRSSSIPRRDQRGHHAARRPLRRRQLGEPDARRVGLQLGNTGATAWKYGRPFQQVARFRCARVSLACGLERLAMYVQGVESVSDLDFNGGETSRLRRRFSVQLSRNTTALISGHAQHQRLLYSVERQSGMRLRCSSGASQANVIYWRFPPMTSASRRAISSTCSTPAARYRSPSVRAIS